jgi:hypothetical protein
MRGAFLESDQYFVRYARVQTIRFARNRIRFVNKRLRASHPTRQDRSGRGKSAHPKNRSGQKRSVDAPACVEPLYKLTQKRNCLGGE